MVCFLVIRISGDLWNNNLMYRFNNEVSNEHIVLMHFHFKIISSNKIAYLEMFSFELPTI